MNSNNMLSYPKLNIFKNENMQNTIAIKFQSIRYIYNTPNVEN